MTEMNGGGLDGRGLEPQERKVPMSQVDEIEAVLIVKPGETLVVKAGRDVLPEHVEELARRMESRVAEGVRVLLLGGDIDSIKVVANREADRIAEAVRKAADPITQA